MSEPFSPDSLQLLGYVPLTSHGFALPCYGSAPSPNLIYTARCCVDGDHNSIITSFDPFEADITRLPPELQRDVAVGAPWQDVFLWQGAAYVGTPTLLWEALVPHHAAIAEQAPLSMLDLAIYAGQREAGALVAQAAAYLRQHYGEQAASDWQYKTLPRQQLLLALRQMMANEHLLRTVSDSLHDIVLSPTADGACHIALPAELAAALQTGDASTVLHAHLAAIAALLGFPLLVVIQKSPAATAHSEQPEPYFTPEHMNMLVVVNGPRAARIASFIRRPEWLPHWADQRLSGDHYLVARDPVPPIADVHRPTIDIMMDGSLPENLAPYAAVIFLTDDAIISDSKHLYNLIEEVQALNHEGNAVILFAPALPADRPSQWLSSHAPTRFLAEFDAIIDTSRARAPSLQNSTGRTLDRLIADCLIGAGLLCTGDSPVRRYLKKHMPAGEKPQLLTYGLFGSTRVLQGNTPALALSSEAHLVSNWHQSSAHVSGNIEFGITSPRKVLQRLFGLLSIQPLRPDFERFAIEIVREITDGYPYMDMDYHPQVIPEAIRQALAAPTMAVGFSVPNKTIRGLAIVAERVDTRLVRMAASSGWAVAYYSDKNTIADVLLRSRDMKVPILPHDIKLPAIHPLPSNRGLAGFDFDDPDITRRLLKTILLADASPLRPTDYRRFAILHGALPLRIMELRPDIHQIHTTARMLDGDACTPALLASRIFAVWLKATAKSAGRALYDTIRKACETFPFPEPFAVTYHKNHGPVLTCTDMRSTVGKRCLDFYHHAPDHQWHTELSAEYRSLLHAVDSALLDILHLDPAATDFDILERLIAMNQQQSGQPQQ